MQRRVDAPAWLQQRREDRPGQEKPLLGRRFEELRAVYRARNSRRVTVQRGGAPMWLAKLGSGMGPVFAGHMPDLVPSEVYQRDRELIPSDAHLRRHRERSVSAAS